MGKFKTYTGNKWVDIISGGIPDSGDLKARYDASEISASDGDTVSSWADQTGNGHDLTAGTTPTFQTGVINGNPAVRFDGADDFLDVSFSSISQPNTVYIVAKAQTAGEAAVETIFDGGARNEGKIQSQDDSNNNVWLLYSGSILNSNTAEDTNPHIFSTLFNGSSSELRLDGTQIASGDAGTNSLTGVTLGSSGGQDQWGDFDIGEVLVYPQNKSGIHSDVESYLSGKWGIAV